MTTQIESFILFEITTKCEVCGEMATIRNVIFIIRITAAGWIDRCDSDG